MFSHTAEYALRAMVWLAHHPDTPLTTHQVAEATCVPAGYLAKILQTLARGGLITAQRGVHGGFMLARPATEISLLDVLDVVAPIQRIRECPLGIPSHGAQLCPLHRRLDETMAFAEARFAEANLADLLEDPTGLTPLCCEPPTPDKPDPPGGGAAGGASP
ncbi:MAG: RrF2 family transcriptional regulator [Phycisphaeraceae bacterium]